MDKKQILQRVAPCSLMCHTCSAYKDGVISKNANQLLKSLSGMKEFYQRHIPDMVKRYSDFEGTLRNYGTGICSGCRSNEHNICSIKGCFILHCVTEHGVDFCGECSEFPCEKTNGLFEEAVYEQWLSGNQQIKESGIATFWKNNSEKPHYEEYTK